jgi:hypothetical protein
MLVLPVGYVTFQEHTRSGVRLHVSSMSIQPIPEVLFGSSSCVSLACRKEELLDLHLHFVYGVLTALVRTLEPPIYEAPAMLAVSQATRSNKHKSGKRQPAAGSRRTTTKVVAGSLFRIQLHLSS